MKTQELEQSHTTVNENDNSNSSKNTEMIQREEVENSPFQIITIEGKHFLTLGNYRVTEETTDKEILREMVKQRDWRLLASYTTIIAEKVINEHNNEK